MQLLLIILVLSVLSTLRKDQCQTAAFLTIANRNVTVMCDFICLELKGFPLAPEIIHGVSIKKVSILGCQLAIPWATSGMREEKNVLRNTQAVHMTDTL